MKNLTIGNLLSSAIKLDSVAFYDFCKSIAITPNYMRSRAATNEVNRLLKQYATFNKTPASDAEWLEFATWITENKALNISSSNWAFTKSRILTVIDDPRIREILNSVVNTNDKKLAQKTPAKQMPDEVMSQLSKVLKNVQSIHAEDALRWLRVTRLTGLRPKEWPFTTIIFGDAPYLRIVNATKGSSQLRGEDAPLLRNFPINHLSDIEIEEIASHIAISTRIYQEGGDAGFVQFQKAVSQVIYNANKHLPDKMKEAGNYGLYSCRHQLFADLKKSGQYSIKSIGTLLGTSSEWIVRRTYAGKRKGRSDSNLPIIDE